MIGTTAALLGAAAIGAVSSAISGSSQKKAANQAAQVATQNTQENNQLARDMYASNTALLTPYSDMGLRAGRTLSDMLLGPTPAPAPPPAAYAPGSYGGGSYDLSGGYGAPVYGFTAPTYGGAGRGPLSVRMENGEPVVDNVVDTGSFSPALGALNGGSTYSPQPYGTPQPMTAAGTVTSSAPSAWDTFRNSTNYQFRLGEGERALNQGFAARGSLNSGAAAKALLRYGQDYASNELGTYMNLLGGQQNMGLNAARAVAGVGGDLVSGVTANNNAGAGAVANADLLKGQANAGMIQGIGGSLGRALGALGGSSYLPKTGNAYGL